MADIVDQTQEREDGQLPLRILASRKAEGPAPTGHCLNCETALPEGHRWCDTSCREDWERLVRAKAQRPE